MIKSWNFNQITQIYCTTVPNILLENSIKKYQNGIAFFQMVNTAQMQCIWWQVMALVLHTCIKF